MGDPAVNDSKCCHPIRSLDEMLNWAPPEEDWARLVKPIVNRSDFCYLTSTDCTVKSRQKFHKLDVPKTLFCHDMKGGYLEDKYVDGSEVHDSYRFFHWSNIDIFVYFSHEFVTIPPLAWINAGHRHGVPVLGVIITEWKPGSAICEEFLQDDSKMIALSKNLANLCSHYCFDGYLVNIENNLSCHEAWKMVDFVTNLKKAMRNVNENSILIWYDSVIMPSGQLKWQNKLNDYNRSFFDTADGIFLNYNWSDRDLQISKRNARERTKDVYVGVDVHGRGCYGGGGDNTYKAMAVARKYNLSVSLFGPAWVDEAKLPGESFIQRDLTFWKSLTPFLYTYGLGQLPIQTSFCQGYGEKTFINGSVVSEKPWYNLNQQNYQPTDLCGFDGCSEDFCLSHYTREAFNGGSCLKISPCRNNDEGKTHHVHRLFVCNLEVNSCDAIKVKIVSKPLNPKQNSELGIVLYIQEDSGGSRELYLMPTTPDNNAIVDYVLPSIYEGHESCELNGWLPRLFKFSVGGCVIIEIGCFITGQSPVLFGEFSVNGSPSDCNCTHAWCLRTVINNVTKKNQLRDKGKDKKEAASCSIAKEQDTA